MVENIEKGEKMEGIKLSMELGVVSDIDAVDALYETAHDMLEREINYPGWKRGVYPIREDAVNGINAKELFVVQYKGELVGSIILNHKAENAHCIVNWQISADDREVLIIHTFVIHPSYSKMGIGKKVIGFVEELAKQNKMKAIRLDVYEKNIPAIKLYEKCGYQYIQTVDLGYGKMGLNWFKLYEKLL